MADHNNVKAIPIFFDLIRLWHHISSERRWQLFGLILLMFLGMLAEMATLGAVVPFLSILSDPSAVIKFSFFEKLAAWFEIELANDVLLMAAILFVIITIIAALLRMVLMWSSLRISYGLGADIGSKLYLQTLLRPYSWHISKNSSEIIAGIDKVNSVVNGVIVQVIQGVVALTLSVGIILMLIVVDLKTALIAGLSFFCFYFITTRIVRNELVQSSSMISVAMTKRIKAVQEGLGGIRDVLLDGTQSVYHKLYSESDYVVRRAQVTSNYLAALPRYILEAVGMTLIVMLAYLFADQTGGLSSGLPLLGVLAVGSQKLLPQMQIVYNSFVSINSNHKQLVDVIALLDSPISDGKINLTKNVVQENIVEVNQPLVALREVSFRYGNNLPYILRAINFEILKGSRVGLIGETGSGKSTFADLILGLLLPTSGAIYVEGSLLTNEKIYLWRRKVAHVPQSIYLSDASVAENIAFGVSSDILNMNRVRESAEAAQIDQFIESLPNGYQTQVGERGVRLSGGQRQRIALARALYKKAEILVLDEATSALDDATEDSVMRVIDGLGNELTLIIIAHRLSTLRGCDEIIELNQGSISWAGTYESIIQR